MVIFRGRSEIGRTEIAVEKLARRRGGAGRCECDRLEEQAAQVRERGATAVHTCGFDADDLASHVSVIDTIEAAHGRIGTAVWPSACWVIRPAPNDVRPRRGGGAHRLSSLR